jgi:hypothetical protein
MFLTWQKVLPDRSPEKPITFQVELTPGGRFRFAYDLVSATGTDLSTNVLAGAFFGDCRVTGTVWRNDHIAPQSASSPRHLTQRSILNYHPVLVAEPAGAPFGP